MPIKIKPENPRVDFFKRFQKFLDAQNDILITSQSFKPGGVVPSHNGCDFNINPLPSEVVISGSCKATLEILKQINAINVCLKLD